MSDSAQHTNAVKIEVLVKCEEEGWDAGEAARQLGIQRTTVFGWMENKTDIFASTADHWSKRIAPPGKSAPTSPYDVAIVKRVKHRVSNGEEVFRGDVIADAIKTIPGFRERKVPAQGSWATRFINRHNLSSIISSHTKKRQSVLKDEPLPKKIKSPLSSLPEKPKSPVSSLSEKPRSPVSSLPEKPRSPVSSLHENSKSPEIISLLSEESNVHTVDNDFGEEWNISPEHIVCETQTPCFVQGKTTTRLVIKGTDVMTLRDDNWLNDAIITYYFRTMLAPYGRTYVMDSNLFGYIYNEYKLANRKMLDAYKTCCGVTATFPYEKYDRIIVPICMGYHWTFAICKTRCLSPTKQN